MIIKTNKTVAQLIAALQKMPPDAEVRYAWDSGLRSDAEYVWLTRSGIVGIGEEGEPVHGNDQPEGAGPRYYVGAGIVVGGGGGAPDRPTQTYFATGTNGEPGASWPPPQAGHGAADPVDTSR